tara:strand:- start:1118 stop:2275 length:1158 start_codon:yes stop_codon:yes gene_type:complete
MNIYFWCPFISEVATIKTVINTAKSINDFSKKKINLKLINAFGEWDQMKKNLSNIELEIINFNKINFNKFLPSHGFFGSRSRYLIIFIKSFFKLHSLLKNNKAEYLICFLVTSLPLTLSLLFNYKCKIILRISGYPKLNIFRMFLWRLVRNKIYLVTCPTKETYKKICSLKIFDINKIVFLPEPVLSIREFRESKNDTQEVNSNKIFKPKDAVLTIGRLTRQKNHIFLVNSISEIFKKYKDLKLYIIGDGELKKEIENTIKKLNLSDRIFLLGYKKNVFQYLKNCKCFVLSSLWEDPGYVLIEAAMSNTSIISSNCPNGPEEILDSGSSGFLFKSDSKQDLIKKFDEFMNSNTEELQKKKINAKKRIKIYTNFTHYKYLKNYLNI